MIALDWWSIYVGLLVGGAVGIFVGIFVGFTANIKLKQPPREGK